MSDLNEKLAQEAAELINGGEWRDGKWYSDGQRDAWRMALKPAADRIEKLEAELHSCFHRIEELQAALQWYAEHCRKGGDKIEGPFGDYGQKARKALEGKDD